MDVLLERCAGIDVAKDEVVACVRTPGPDGRGRRKQTRTFLSFTAELEAMADWLAAERVTEVVMEATGVDAVFAANQSEAGVPFVTARDRLDTITGVGKRAAECIIAEIGVEMSQFPTAGHLASWAGMAPGNNITGGKRHSGKTTKGDVWLCDMLTQCAWAAARTRDTYLSAQFWRLARRIGKKKTTVAVGHSILVICWHLLTNDCDYDDLGGDYFARRGDTARHEQHLVRQLQDLGYAVTLRKAA